MHQERIIIFMQERILIFNCIAMKWFTTWGVISIRNSSKQVKMEIIRIEEICSFHFTTNRYQSNYV